MRGFITVGAALAGALIGIALGPSSARAEGPGAVALSRFEPTPAGDPLFGVPSPFIGGHLVPRGLALFDHAEDPLTLGGGASPEREIVGSQSLLHVGGSLSLWDRLLVSASLPLALAQSGDGAAAAAGAGAPEAPSSPAFGDLRLGVRVRLLGDEGDPFQIGTSASLHLPTGSSDAYVGEGAVRVTPQLLLGGRVARVVWSVAAGAVMRSSESPSTLAYGGGAGVLLWDERLQLGPEVYAETMLQGGSLSLTARERVEVERTTSAELLLGARFRPFRPLAGLVVGAAAGPGIGDAIGTPSFRAMGTVAWAPPAPPPAGAAADAGANADPDMDGIAGARDACPYAHGPASADAKRNGCPVEDEDEDGVADPDDLCPHAAAGSGGGDPSRRGCPADQDGDGLPDALDACPTEKGDAAGGATRPGCPPAPRQPTDQDGDGLPDDADACPREKGPASGDAPASGCPTRVRVQGEQILLLEPVVFRVLKNDPAPIDPKSEAVLAEVRDVIEQHPEWVKIEVSAHTDGAGNARFNETLSTARAEAVRRWLVGKGIAAERLVAKGYGASQPISDDRSAAGREKNRRVQLLVLEKR
ncbi:OmpA family protein [Sorangium sp. So ce117]|uniref:OmpA family protein n=1 Tax=Sorangium sp. So ce117 TaxID=3133277 RepID=UPI003F61B6D8